MRDRPAATLLIFIAVCLSAATAAADGWIRVRWVNDGDTIVLVDGRRVRYVGIDAPEIAHETYQKKAEPLGYEALAFNRHLVHRKRVRLELDRQTHDAYQRLLAYVFLPGKRMVNEQMVVNGLAYCLPHWPNERYASLLLKAQRTAMSATRGIWRQWKPIDEAVIGNRRSRRFHTPSCPNAGRISARNRILFDSPWEAFWEGYAPAGGCFKGKK
jgi:micrococcal nuclease